MWKRVSLRIHYLPQSITLSNDSTFTTFISFLFELFPFFCTLRRPFSTHCMQPPFTRTETFRFSQILSTHDYDFTYFRACSDIVVALIFLLSHRLDTSKHFLANFLVISNHMWHLNFTDYFGNKGFTWDSNNGLQTLLNKSFPFSDSLVTLHSDTYHTCKRCASPTPLEKKSLGTTSLRACAFL